MGTNLYALVIWGALLGSIIYFWNNIINYFSVRRQLSKLHGPKGLPFIGNAIDLAAAHEDIWPVLASWWKTYKSKGLMKVSLLHKIFVIPTNARLLEGVLGNSRLIEKSDDYRYLIPWLGTGLLTSKGKKWRTRRKMLTPCFHFKILEDFIHIFNEQSIILTRRLRKEADKPFDIFPFITTCALDIICESAMGCAINAQGDKNSDYVKAVFGIADVIHSRHFRPWLWPDGLFALLPEGRKHQFYLNILHNFTLKIIREHRAERESKTSRDEIPEDKRNRLAFLDLLLEKTSKNESNLSDEDIREEVDTFLFAGLDTTGAAISWSLYLLGLYPDIQRKVQEELDTVLGSEECYVTAENLKELKYLDLVTKEALRIYPSAPLIVRKVNHQFTLGDYSIPAGVNILIIPILLHRDEDVFPNPEEFNPERFRKTNDQKRSPYSYIPFSAGPRNCIGQRFAQMEEKIILAHILHSFHVESLLPREEMKVLMELILRPKNGIVVKLTPRKRDPMRN